MAFRVTCRMRSPVRGADEPSTFAVLIIAFSGCAINATKALTPLDYPRSSLALSVPSMQGLQWLLDNNKALKSGFPIWLRVEATPCVYLLTTMVFNYLEVVTLLLLVITLADTAQRCASPRV